MRLLAGRCQLSFVTLWLISELAKWLEACGRNGSSVGGDDKEADRGSSDDETAAEGHEHSSAEEACREVAGQTGAVRAAIRYCSHDYTFVDSKEQLDEVGRVILDWGGLFPPDWSR